MKPNRGKYIIYAIILLIAIIFPILIYVFSTSVCTPELSIVVTVLTIILDVLSLAYFIVQDLVSNSRTIAHHGSLSLFETVDREAVNKNVIERLKEHPDAHVVYMACSGLPRIELENIKQRIYEDLTNYKKIDGEKFSRRNRLCISNVFLPAALELPTSCLPLLSKKKGGFPLHRSYRIKEALRHFLKLNLCWFLAFCAFPSPTP